MKKIVLILTLLIITSTKEAFAQPTSANDLCTLCSEEYVSIYLEEYFDVLATLTAAEADTFCPDCVEIWMIDSARTSAIYVSKNLGCLDTNQSTGQINLDSIVYQMEFHPIDSTFTFDDQDDAIALNNWLQFNPQALPGIIPKPGCDLTFFYVGVIDTSVLQPNPIILDISATFDPDSNALCVTSVFGSSFFTLLNCDSVLFLPDSTFVGNDTCYYIVCDSVSLLLCDTGIIIITVIPDSSLLPSAFFSETPTFFCYNTIDAYTTYFTVEDTSINSDSIYWSFRFLNNFCADSVEYFLGDTMISFTPWQIAQLTNCLYSSHVEVCLTALNDFGSDSQCDTICYVVWEGIDEIPLIPIHIFPNPAKDYLTITTDERKTGGIIQITDITGKEIISVKLQAKELKIETNKFSAGLYFVRFIDKKGIISVSKLMIE